MPSDSQAHIAIGDIHGNLERLQTLLYNHGITDAAGNWQADNTHLYFLGDYCDRGPDGLGVLNLVMRLETQAGAADGLVVALLGNHDVMLLAAHHFGNTPVPGFLRAGQRIGFSQMWQQNAGGQPQDLAGLSASHVAWLELRPAMWRVADQLLIHADSDFYLQYGDDLPEINGNIRAVLRNHEVLSYDMLEERFAKRKAFSENGRLALDFADRFGVKRILHGHTPICGLRNVAADLVVEPLVYAQGLCVNLDHGLCYGGAGFVYQF